MDIVTMLRDLWRFRLVVVGAWILAMGVGVLVLYQVSFPTSMVSRKYDVGVATTSILIDTPSSQVVELAPEGSDILGGRADLLARMMVNGVVKDAIAKTAGLPPNALVGVSPTDQPAASARSRLAPVLQTRVVVNNDGTVIPIIEISTQARTAADAAKLADAAIKGLRSYLDQKAAAQHVSNAKRLQVSALGVTQAETVVRGPKDVFAVAVVLLVFGLECAFILIVIALMRGWRAAVFAEDYPPADRVEYEPAPPASPAIDSGHATAIRDAPVPTPPSTGGGWMSAPPKPSLTVARSTPEPDPGADAYAHAPSMHDVR